MLRNCAVSEKEQIDMYEWSKDAANDTPFVMIDTNGNELTGLTVSVALRKPGAASFAPGGGTVTEIGSGWYNYANTAAEADTAGNGALKATATGAVQQNVTFVVRNLPQLAAAVAPAVSGTAITVYRGTTWIIPLTGLGDISTYDTLYFSVKARVDDSDNDAYLRVRNAAAGLERFNQAAPTAATNGTITIDDAIAGDITITVQEIETQNISSRKGLSYDVKGVDDDGNVVLLSLGKGQFNIGGDVTRKITS